jgi:hypothetical protein
MGPILFVMAILGCGEGDSDCQPVRVAPQHYTSEAACMAATGAELARTEDLLFPSVVAQCRPASETLRPLPASEVRLPDPDRVQSLPSVRIARGAARVSRRS